jgi:hypothetical protein
MRVELVKAIDGELITKHEYVDFFTMVSDDRMIKEQNIERPFVRMSKTKRYLKTEIHNWFVSLNADYSIYLEKSDVTPQPSRLLWALDIPDDDVALLFKLTWF